MRMPSTEPPSTARLFATCDVSLSLFVSRFSGKVFMKWRSCHLKEQIYIGIIMEVDFFQDFLVIFPPDSSEATY